jgi:hypothetical protein
MASISFCPVAPFFLPFCVFGSLLPSPFLAIFSLSCCFVSLCPRPYHHLSCSSEQCRPGPRLDGVLGLLRTRVTLGGCCALSVWPSGRSISTETVSEPEDRSTAATGCSRKASPSHCRKGTCVSPPTSTDMGSGLMETNISGKEGEVEPGF